MRLVGQKPKYVIIDEGTAAVSSDVEGLLYETCKAHGISTPSYPRPFSITNLHHTNTKSQR